MRGGTTDTEDTEASPPGEGKMTETQSDPLPEARAKQKVYSCRNWLFNILAIAKPREFQLSIPIMFHIIFLLYGF